MRTKILMRRGFLLFRIDNKWTPQETRALPDSLTGAGRRGRGRTDGGREGRTDGDAIAAPEIPGIPARAGAGRTVLHAAMRAAGRAVRQAGRSGGRTAGGRRTRV